MGSLVVVILIALTIYCSEVYCDTLPTTIAKPEDTGFVERNNSHESDKGTIWKSLSLPQRKSTKLQESKTLDSATIEANRRKSRFLGTLAFLAGLSFGGLANAASSTVRNKLPQASFSLNLGPSKTSPYFAAFYNPYSLLPYPLFYPGLGLVPMTDHTKPQTSSHNELTPQVISVFDNREPIDFAENDEEYVDGEKKSNNGKKVNNDKSGSGDHMESRGEADRNAEEKTTIRGCKEDQRKHGSFVKGSFRQREGLQVDGLLPPTMNLQPANMTAGASMNQVMPGNTTGMTMTTDNPFKGQTLRPPTTMTTEYIPHYPYYYYAHNITPTTRPPFPGYYGGHPQNLNRVDLTTGSDLAYRYPPTYSSPINYNLPYEQPASFYHNDKYNVYPSPHVNAHFAGPFSADQTNEYASPNLDRPYHSEYQPPYADGFRPVK